MDKITLLRWYKADRRKAEEMDMQWLEGLYTGQASAWHIVWDIEYGKSEVRMRLQSIADKKQKLERLQKRSK